MICLRIVAYMTRSTRKHSTLFQVVFAIVILTIIAQLYHYKRDEDKYSPWQRIGNYEYRPGAFLQNFHPDENHSYCLFNYGLPHRLEWGSFKLLHSPEEGTRGPYHVIYNAVQGTAYYNRTKYNVATYATQSTPEFLYHIVEIARFWDGPISLAVFVPNHDMDLTMQIMSHLCSCYRNMAKVSLHLFYPQRFPPLVKNREGESKPKAKSEEREIYDKDKVTNDLRQKMENFRAYANKTRAEFVTMVRKNKAKRLMTSFTPKIAANRIYFQDCAGPESNIETFRKQHNLVYPINVGRNVARNGSTTDYFLVSDIEMVPSDGLATKFVKMLNKLIGTKERKVGRVFARTVFVIPLFEVERGEEIPRDKKTLVQLVTANRASYFHQKTCSHCQKFPGLQSWLERSPPDSLEPMLIAKREYPYHRWEPLYFGTRNEPWYSESMSWEGRQDKMTQMVELCLLEYRLLVLDGGFLCHASSTILAARRRPRAERVNARRYAAIMKRLRGKYKERPQCKLG